jgi:hypothetical protein
MNWTNNSKGEASSIKKSKPITLSEKIKKGAAILAETKMIDKVSISSSNYDEYDLNNLNNKV